MAKKVLDHYENPRNVGILDKDASKCRDWNGWCTSLWRCNEITNSD